MPRISDRQRIAQDIRDRIASGEYGPGAKLPSLRELTARYGVSAEPVRSAILILQAEGLLEGRQGKGVYVTGAPKASDGVTPSAPAERTARFGPVS
ncbi:winged helix-turn-helix domain-containing protein [Micromonospora sp. NPDC049559]|uniref:winged helix-turn-helix domain-containing protein n=1 Tax=Micromonospora sp. NPDC049559 TaxID=3155923 RepID=UPI00341A5B2F